MSIFYLCALKLNYSQIGVDFFRCIASNLKYARFSSQPFESRYCFTMFYRGMPFDMKLVSGDDIRVRLPPLINYKWIEWEFGSDVVKSMQRNHVHSNEIIATKHERKYEDTGVFYGGCDAEGYHQFPYANHWGTRDGRWLGDGLRELTGLCDKLARDHKQETKDVVLGSLVDFCQEFDLNDQDLIAWQNLSNDKWSPPIKKERRPFICCCTGINCNKRGNPTMDILEKFDLILLFYDP